MPYLIIRSYHACTIFEGRKGNTKKVDLDEFRALSVRPKEFMDSLMKFSTIKFNSIKVLVDIKS